MFKNKKPLIVGAGPVGMFAALSLKKRGIEVSIIDKENRPGTHSYALALHPDTLDLMESVGLLDQILDQAYLIRNVALFDGKERRAEICFTDLQKRHPFLAVLRQNDLESLMEEALRREGIKVKWNHRVSSLSTAPNKKGVEVTVDQLEQRFHGYAAARLDWGVAKILHMHPPFVIGADGHASHVRRSLDIGFPKMGHAQYFAVFEFKSDIDLEHEMRLVLMDNSTNVLWPLPDGSCRWSFQLSDYEVSDDSREKDRFLIQLGSSGYPMLNEESLTHLIEERAPWFKGSIDDIKWRLVVCFERRLAQAMGQGLVWLAGDAIHLTGPAGIQSMNIGFREADEIARIVAKDWPGDLDPVELENYNSGRLEEWRFLLGMNETKPLKGGSDIWIQKHFDKIIPSIPASGDTLYTLARQIGIEWG